MGTRKITSSYIKENYNIDEMRETLKEKKIVKSVDISLLFSDNQKLSKEDIIIAIDNQLSDQEDYDYILMQHYGYSGGFSFELIKEKDVPETDSQTIERLKKIERFKRKKEKEIEKAKKLLSDLED